MNSFQSIALGVLQGVAEFLPISSSGHLALAEKFFALNQPLIFDVFLHIATLIVVCIFFRETIADLFRAFFKMILRKPIDENFSGKSELTLTDERARKTVIAIIVTTIVTGALGIFFEKFIRDFPIQSVCVGFLITAFLLILSWKIGERIEAVRTNENAKQKNISLVQAIVIGVFQGIGVLPGISRSGATIAGGLLSGLSRSACGEFSFIVSIPAILGAFLLELKDLAFFSEINFLQLVLAFVSSLVAGWLSLSFLMRMIKKGALVYFAFYLIPLGLCCLILFF